jgi:cytochrome c biogenesis protein CcmG, thiol:disulfide interchange protein DsbE
MRRLAVPLVVILVLSACASSSPDAGDPTTTATAGTSASTTTAPEADPCVENVARAITTLDELVRVYASAQDLDQEGDDFAAAVERLEELDNRIQDLMNAAAASGCDDETVLAIIDESAAPLDQEWADEFDEPVRRSALSAWLAVGGATIDGQALPPYDGDTDAAVGMAMPAAEATSLAGEPMAIARNGRPKAIMFVAHWCPHCRTEVTELAPWLAGTVLPGDVEVIAVATGTDPTLDNYPPSEWFAAAGWPDPVLDDRGNVVADAFGLSAYPYWVFVDSDGLVVERRTGAIGLDEVVAMLDRLSAS